MDKSEKRCPCPIDKRSLSRNIRPVTDSSKLSPRRTSIRSRETPLPIRQMATVYRIWDQLDQFPAGEQDEAPKQFALLLQKELKADNVKWMADVRVLHGAKAKKDPLLGWRLRAGYDLVPDPAEYQKHVAWLYQPCNLPEPGFQIGLATHAMIAGAGKFRVHRMRDGWIPFREFSRSEHYRVHYKELGLTDRIWISFPLNADTESIFLIDRSRRARFTAREALLVGTILRGIQGFHRRLFLSRGVRMGGKELSPMLRLLVQKLLTGLSEKEIAGAMNQSPATTHKNIGMVYERFGVNGRAALMALWMGS